MKCVLVRVNEPKTTNYLMILTYFLTCNDPGVSYVNGA